jgi:hypothetical protein
VGHRAQEAGVGFDDGRAGLEVDRELRAAHDRGERVARVVDDRIGAQARGEDLGAPGEREELARELRHPARGALDAAERVGGRRADRVVLAGGGRLGEHADEEVVEVVRDPTCDDREALEVALVGGRLGAFALGDVDRDRLDDRPAIDVGDRDDDLEQARARRGDEADLVDRPAVGVGGLDEHVPAGGELGDEDVDRHPLEGLLGGAGRGGVGGEDRTVELEQEGRDGERLEGGGSRQASRQGHEREKSAVPAPARGLYGGCASELWGMRKGFAYLRSEISAWYG